MVFPPFVIRNSRRQHPQPECVEHGARFFVCVCLDLRKLFQQKDKENILLFIGVAKHQDFKLVDDEPPNNTDVEATLQKVKDNDSETKEVILNNIKVSRQKILCFEIEAQLLSHCVV